MKKFLIIVVLAAVGCSSMKDETRPAPQPSAYAAPAGAEHQAVSGISGDTLLTGLKNLNVNDTLANVHDSSAVVDISDVLSAGDLQVLTTSIRDDAKLNTNSAQLTGELQKRGVIGLEERIVGASGGKLYKTSVI